MEAQEPLTAPSPVSDWKERSRPHVVRVPSGHMALLQRRPLAAFWKAGLIPNSLMPIVRKSIASGQAVDSEEWDDQKLRDMMLLVDTITIECTIEPQVSPVPVCKECRREKSDEIHAQHAYLGEERSDDLLYVDEVDFDDKAFIYQWAVGVVDDVSGFRKTARGDVEPVSSGEDVEREAISADSTADGG